MSKNTILADEQQALDDYLGALLSEPVPHLRPVETREAPSVRELPLPREIPVAPPVVPEIETPVPVAESGTSQPAPVAGAEPPQPEPLLPAWAEERFQCLLFNVAGLNLAVPLACLNGVLGWPEDITPMPGHADHFLGLLQHLDQQVKVIDTAGVVLPPERLAALDSADRRYGNVILIDEGRWGLACDRVGEVVTLDKDGVRWRTRSGKRRWLAGTVIEHMCALLDTGQMARGLASGQFDE